MSAIAIHPTFHTHPVQPTRPAVPAESARTARPPQGQLRLTRRGRVAVFLAGLVAIMATAVAMGAGSVATEERGEPVLTEMHTVASGETLWAIADRIDDTGSTADMVDRIEQMNALDSANLMVGQELRVPVAP